MKLTRYSNTNMVDLRSTVAVIPARGGSKGLPGKNLKVVAGLPLVAHAINAALGAGLANRTFVSTDDSEIAKVAQSHGAQVISRPAELASDTASSESALLHALDHLEQTQALRPEVLVFLQCTSPLMRPEDISGTLHALFDQNADTALAVTPFHGFVWKRSGDSAAGVNHDPAIRLRRQERESEYLETTAVYVMRVRGFRLARHRFFGKIALHVISSVPIVDIDDANDLLIAEQLLLLHGRRLSTGVGVGS